MKRWPLLVITVLLFACSGKKKPAPGEETGSFPALSFIQSQVKDVDTSLYGITKIVTFNGKSDTTNLMREQFRKEAQIFLALPDISSENLREDYSESKVFDETLKRVAFFYTSKNAEASVQREQIIIDPNKGQGGQVQTIIVDFYDDKDKDSPHKVLTWQVNSYFDIAETLVGPGGTEPVRHTRVVWNDFTRDNP